MPCTCTPGEPLPPGDERPEDLVDVRGMDEESARIYLDAAREALRRAIEPGIRRARWIDGYVAGHDAK